MYFVGCLHIIWIKNFGGSDDDEGFKSVELSDHTYLVAGSTYSDDIDVAFNNGGSDVWLLNVDTNGAKRWEKSYGDVNDEIATNLSIMSSGEYFLVAISNSLSGNVIGNHGNNDIWAFVIDTVTKNISRQKCFGGTLDDEPICMLNTNTDSIIIGGYSDSNDGDLTNNKGDYDAWVLCIDTLLNLRWQKSFGGSKEEATTGLDIKNSEIICTGYTYSTDSDVVGNHSNNSDVWLLKLDQIISGINDLNGNNYFKIILSHERGTFLIESNKRISQCQIEIDNVLGQCNYLDEISFSQNVPITIDANLSAGIYIVTISNNGKKLISQKIYAY